VINNQVLPDEQEFADLEAKLFSRLEHGEKRKVRRHRLVAAAAIVMISGGAVAANSVATDSSQQNLATCYSAADTGSHSVQLSGALSRSATDHSLTLTSIHERTASALSRCGAAWQAGVLAGGSATPTTTVPALQACLSNNQVIEVFPKSDSRVTATAFCGNLGLSVAR
jgi:hypothetical protein